MTRKFKALGLVLLGILAMVALATASGWAGEEGEEEQNKPKRFWTVYADEGKGEPALLTGEQQETAKFTFTKGELLCNEFHLTGKMAANEEKELTMALAYTSGCTAFGLESHVEINGCHLLFKLLKGTFPTGKVSTHTQGPVEIKCPANKQIEIKVTKDEAAFCTVAIPPQKPTEPKIDQKNEAAGFNFGIQLTFTVTGLHYEVTGGGGDCGEVGKTLTDGAIDAKVMVTSRKSKSGTPGAQQDIKVIGELDP
jgi:hypothetical protein